MKPDDGRYGRENRGVPYIPLSEQWASTSLVCYVSIRDLHCPKSKNDRNVGKFNPDRNTHIHECEMRTHSPTQSLKVESRQRQRETWLRQSHQEQLRISTVFGLMFEVRKKQRQRSKKHPAQSQSRKPQAVFSVPTFRLRRRFSDQAKGGRYYELYVYVTEYSIILCSLNFLNLAGGKA